MGLFKQTFQQLQTFFDKHDKVLVKEDVVNTLESDETEKPLSAAQGKALKTLIPPKYTLPVASSEALGGIQLGFTQTGKKYPVMVEGNKAYVEVPWTDTNTTYTIATDSVAGLFKVGYAENAKNYAVKVDENGKAYVTVPWTDNNTTYVAATAETLGLVKQGVAVADAGAEDVQAKFNALLASLRGSGVIANS